LNVQAFLRRAGIIALIDVNDRSAPLYFDLWSIPNHSKD
jgi:hypothetical protein